MPCRNECITIRNREDNWQKIFVPIGICRSSKDLLRTNVVVRSREVYNEILWKKVVLVERNKDIGKRCGRVTNISRPVKQLDDLAYVFIYGGRVITIPTGIYGGIVRFVVNKKQGLVGYDIVS